ncbi:MAG TPA: antioxidant AhpC [Balneola sp.]|jgi:peroxiredoxin|nr:antioxidant AhpC [Balneola sp.]MAO77866.1 antioxidant AhpC [Balneola sp.]MBF63320.1 antioxidant AhpC [Balneola sp.]HAH49765.1 antioxidant AhpC [Balneola sp.]HAW81126.1 antioxidant AhpC [Balneola sp.]|tara:strand:+ start:7500 stop:8135 length:636 start_codon:yes stop_codon:yes gene_type:complete
MTLLRFNTPFLTLIALFFLFHTNSYAQDYATSAEKVNPVLISSTIPDVSVKNTDGKNLNLRDLVKEQPTIFVFYRGGWCPYCNSHLADLKTIEEDLSKEGYKVYAISADRPELLKQTMTKNELTYTLLSDAPMTAAKAFGIAFKMDDKTVERYKSFDIDIEKDSGYDHHLLPAPAVFLVDQEGTIKFSYVNPNYKERIDGGILLAAAKAFN